MKCRDLSINTFRNNCLLLQIVVKPDMSENKAEISTNVLTSQPQRQTASSRVVDASLGRRKYANLALCVKSISSGERWQKNFLGSLPTLVNRSATRPPSCQSMYVNGMEVRI